MFGVGPFAFFIHLVLMLSRGVEKIGALSDNRDFDIKLVNGIAANEGRVLIRWFPGDSNWTSLCYSSNHAATVAFQLCRRLRYSFACGMEAAGPLRTDNSSLVNVASVKFLATCETHPTEITAGGCILNVSSGVNLVDESPCIHEQDTWLSCGYAGMPDLELRLIDGTGGESRGLVQGRCGGKRDWGAICSNTFYKKRAGNVACRDLELSSFALSVGSASFDEVDIGHTTNYMLFVDIGCVGNEASLSECEHYSLRQCKAYATLECFTEIRDYNDTVYLCGSKQLCGANCQQQIHPLDDSTDNFNYCQCDDACVLFDDCCYDHANVCSPAEPSLERGGFTVDWFGCVWVPGSQFTHIGYVAVNRCPDDWLDEGTRELCERAVNVTDIVGSMPVYDEQGVDFKNIYCALCNGRLLHRSHRWNVFASNLLTSTTEIFYPSLNRSLPSNGWIISPPRGHKVIRQCSAHLIDTCPDEFFGTNIDRACRAYYAPVRPDDQNIRYRNPHCAMCNGKKLIPDKSCTDRVCAGPCNQVPWDPCFFVCGPYDDFFTIEVLFDFTSPSSISGLSCSEGQIYDPFLERCRVLTCAAGYRVKGEECVADSPLSTQTNGTKKVSVVECLTERLGNDSGGGQALIEGLDFSLKDPHSNKISLTILVDSHQSALDIEAAFDLTLDSAMINRSTLDYSLLCNISDLSVLVPFIQFESSYCSSGYWNGTFRGYNGHLLEVVKYQITTNEGQYSKTTTSPLCLQVISLNCSSLLTLEVSEYHIPAEQILEVGTSGTRILVAEYVIFPDGSAVICSFRGPIPLGLEPSIRRALSFAGSCLSLLALTATFVTYCVFPELRNTAGKSTMNLVAALFVAILLFLLAGYLKQNHAVCVAGAAVAHFAWLAVFAWMTVLSISVAYTLGSKVASRPNRRRGIDRILVAYMCLAYGIPFIIVSTCMTVQFCDCTDLPTIYADGGICWITDATVRVVVFAIPVAMSLALNIVLYLYTVIIFRKNRYMSKAARNERATDAAKEELTVYLKICTLVGLTWVFGFVSQSVTGILAFSYIYIILNYLQAVFIFIGFCLNKRVRAMWRRKVRETQAGKVTKNLPTQPKTGLSAKGLVLNATTKNTKL
ncbi:uncharacterized protein LOC110979592 [Acanthaster planci]|uniref:Uncharacterized protein LOC110979592 n=1 Tax=Acanthaster planci TaxID=133434 RepID=A0A8B7YFS2_ACAPL|nr:uncharacterized protein LOC110979592 [Acanthaster planci]